MGISENLFLSVSNILNVRVTPENLRTKMKDINAVGGITSEAKTNMIIELLLAVDKLDKKINEK